MDEFFFYQKCTFCVPFKVLVSQPIEYQELRKFITFVENVNYKKKEIRFASRLILPTRPPRRFPIGELICD
jgi:hypothetical protein